MTGTGDAEPIPVRRDNGMSSHGSASEEGEVVVLDGAAGLEAIAADWEALADAVAAPPWLRPGWVRAWAAAFARGMLVSVTVRRGGELVAVAPLERVGTELRSTTNYHTPSYGLLAREPSARGRLAETLVATAGRRLSIGFLPRDEPSLGDVRAAADAAGRPRVERVLERCPYVEPDGDFGAFLAQRRRHLVREIRRRERRLAARGRLTFEVHDGTTDLDRLLEDGFGVEAAGWKGDRGTAIASSDGTRDFYRAVARMLAARGALRLAFLRLDGHPFAFDFAIEEGGRHALLKTGYDPAFRSEGPGMLLRYRMLERAFDLGLGRYDFLGRDDAWKREWTLLSEDQVLFQVFRGPTGVADWAAQRYLRPMARRVLKR